MMDIASMIARDLMLPQKPLLRLINSAPHRYKVYEVAKKSGKGMRTIAQPAREVKALQYWVIENLLQKFPVHHTALAYRKGKGIRANAEIHASRSFLLKLDFESFFPSIKANDFESYLRTNYPEQYATRDIEYLKKILFWNRNRAGNLILSIGAPSSPILSNVLMYEFDKRVQLYCFRRRVKYSRYADDLTFSTDRPNVLREVEVQVKRICAEMKYPKLRLNTEKTVHASRSGSRRVTGLTLSNEGLVSLGRDRKRLIRAQVHAFINDKMKPEDALVLRGMLAFTNSVEPEFLQRLRDHYGEKAISSIMRFDIQEKDG